MMLIVIKKYFEMSFTTKGKKAFLGLLFYVDDTGTDEKYEKLKIQLQT